MQVGRRTILKALGGVPLAGLVGTAGYGTVARQGIIDVHAHIAIPDYVTMLAAAGVRSPGYGVGAPASAVTANASSGAGGDSEASIASRLRIMDAAGVQLQVLSPSLAPYVSDGPTAQRCARLWNERLSTITRNRPDRFAAIAALPLPHVNSALRELRYALDVLGLSGVGLHSTALGTSVADDRFAPLFAEMDRRSSVLFIHPSVNGLQSPLINGWNLQASAGPLLEDMAMVLHLLARSIPVRYPRIRIVIPHLGGGIATMLERLDNQMPLSIGKLAAKPSEMARMLWYDTASHGSGTSLRAAIEALGSKRLVPGSDFPVLLAFEAYARAFTYVSRNSKDPETGNAILHVNALRLFGRPEAKESR